MAFVLTAWSIKNSNDGYAPASLAFSFAIEGMRRLLAGRQPARQVAGKLCATSNAAGFTARSNCSSKENRLKRRSSGRSRGVQPLAHALREFEAIYARWATLPNAAAVAWRYGAHSCST